MHTSLPLRAVVFGTLLLAAAVAARATAARRAPVTPLTALDYIDIQQLLHRYAFALDTCSNNGYDYADLFTPDGVFYWGVGGRKSVGREQLAEAAGGGKQGCKKLQTAVAREPDPDAHDGQRRHRGVARGRHRQELSGLSGRAGHHRATARTPATWAATRTST